MKTITNDIKELLQDYNKEKDVNHWMRRFARCYFDGSYDYSKIGITCGSDFYNLNLKDYLAMKWCTKHIKRMVVYYFTHFIALEYDCSYSHAQKCIVKSMSKEDLAQLTNELINDYIEIYERGAD